MNISTRFIPSFYSAALAAVLILPFSTPSANAVEVSCAAGGLQAALEEAGVDAATETSLTVTGSLNALDFDFIRQMSALKTLDLSGAAIASYSGPATATGSTDYKADVLPSCALLSSSVEDFSFPEGITEIGSGALGNSKIKELTIPSTVTKIDAGAFSNMESLTRVTIPSSVTSLPSMLFKDCEKLQEAVIEADVTSIPSEFFRNCPALTAVSLPSSLTSIGDFAFSGCSSLAAVTLPASLQSIGDYAFASCTALESLHTPASLTNIGAWSFSGCDNLQDILFENPVATFGEGSFFNASALTTPLGDIAAATKALPDYMLYNASGVDATGFNATMVEKIGAHALSGNSSTTIILPSTLTYLGDYAMEDWNKLEKIEATTLEEVPQLGSSVWEGVDQPNVELIVGAGKLEDYQEAPQWQDFNISQLALSDINIADSDDNAANLRASFEGNLLRLEADFDIRAAQFYDISGRRLTIVNNHGSNRLTVDTAPFAPSVFIVRVLFSEVPASVLKIAR